jgi:hypothetical protein
MTFVNRIESIYQLSKRLVNNFLLKANYSTTDSAVTFASLLNNKQRFQQQPHENLIFSNRTNDDEKKADNISKAMLYYLEKLNQRGKI